MIAAEEDEVGPDRPSAAISGRRNLVLHPVRT